MGYTYSVLATTEGCQPGVIAINAICNEKWLSLQHTVGGLQREQFEVDFWPSQSSLKPVVTCFVPILTALISWGGVSPSRITG